MTSSCSRSGGFGGGDGAARPRPRYNVYAMCEKASRHLATAVRCSSLAAFSASFSERSLFLCASAALQLLRELRSSTSRHAGVKVVD